jgi:hypothetical protein
VEVHQTSLFPSNPQKGANSFLLPMSALRRIGLVRLRSHFQTRAELALMKHFKQAVGSLQQAC